MTNKSKAAQELGRKGGQTVLKKYGKSHYKEMIKKRWEKYRQEQEKLVDQNEVSSEN